MSGRRKYFFAGLTMLMIASFSSACEWTYLIWIPRSPTADPVYRFTHHNKTGYIDRTGRILIEPDRALTEGTTDGEFHDGLLETSVGDGVYVDANGKKVIHKEFYSGWSFSEGLAVAMEKAGGKWGYINTRGEFEISPRFASSLLDYVWSFQGGLAMIEVGGKFGYIDRSGEFVIHPRFLDGDSFHDGMARVIIEGPCVYSRIKEESPCPDFGLVPKGNMTQEIPPSCKYSYIDKTGKVISRERYDYALPFAEGLAPVKIGKSWGYIDKKGVMIITPRFDSASSFSDALGLVSTDGLFGYINRTGSYAIKPKFQHAESFAEGRAVVGDLKSGEWYIDSSGKQVIPGRFAVASPFFKGLAHVKVVDSSGENGIHTGTFEYIDVTGRVVFRYKS